MKNFLNKHGNWYVVTSKIRILLAAWFLIPTAIFAAEAIPSPGSKLPPATSNKLITSADVTAEKVGTTIPASAIGEPVGDVTLSPPRWFEESGNSVAYALVEGVIAPKDPDGKPINFRVLLPASWSRRAIQVGGGGMNGMVPMFRGERPGSATASFARYGSDSGHQMGGFGGMGFGRMGGGPPRGGGRFGGPPMGGGGCAAIMVSG